MANVTTWQIVLQNDFDHPSAQLDAPPLAQFLPGVEVSGWSGLVAPRNTPAAIVALLNKEINAAIADPRFRQRIADLGGMSPGGSSADFATFLVHETDRWANVVKFAGIKAE